MFASLRITPAVVTDVGALTALRAAVATAQTQRYGRGHWSLIGGEASVLRSLGKATVLVARLHGEIVGSLCLVARKPWALDLRYFSSARQALYLTDMAVSPVYQGQGLGRLLVRAAGAEAQRRGVETIRLDAYDAPAGAGPFYARCGFSEAGRVSYRGVPLIYYELMLP